MGISVVVIPEIVNTVETSVRLALYRTAGYAQNGCYILLTPSPFRLETGMAMRRVECSNHFAHTQQFLYSAKNAHCTVQNKLSVLALAVLA